MSEITRDVACLPAGEFSAADASVFERCEVLISAVDRCPNKAAYYAVCHTCTDGLICVWHLKKFTRQLGATDSAHCNGCGRVFASINDAISVIEL